MNAEPNNVDALARIITASNQQPVHGQFADSRIKPLPFVIVPAGYEAKTVPPAGLPEYPIASPTLNDAASFADYVKRFVTPTTTLCLTADHRFVARLDYHDSQHRPNAHTATYPLELSPEWKAWSALHDKWLTQQQVIELFEERRGNIASPAAADLIRVAEDFKAHSSVEMTTRYNRVTQSVTMVVAAEENKRGADEITPPADILISIPVFKHGKKVDLTALFSWSGKPDRFAKLRFVEMEAARDAAIAHERELIAALTTMPVLMGSI